jgi:hypothetical protein
MKSIKQQYIDLREGNMTQANFMRNLRMTMPHLVTNVTSFDDSVRILKNKGILIEADIKMAEPEEETLPKATPSEEEIDNEETTDDVNISFDVSTGEITSNNNDYHRDGFTMGYFEEGLNESKLIISGTDKAIKMLKSELKNNNVTFEIEGNKVMVDDSSKTKMAIKMVKERVGMQSIKLSESKKILKEDKDEKGKWTNADGKSMYGTFKEIDNLNGQEVLIGIDYEMEKNEELTKQEAQKIVIKNLNKIPNYYTNFKLSGKEGYEPEYIGGKSANPEAHQMQPLDKNMGNVVDKKREMQPVKGIEKPKKDSDKGGETNKPEKNIQLMSLIAKTVRGMKKMDATGEKMKKVSVKENKEEFNPGVNLNNLKMSDQAARAKKIYDEEEKKRKEKNSKLKDLIRKEIQEMYDGMELMDRPYPHDEQVNENNTTRIEDKIKSGEIKPEEVKAAAEKAIKGDTTDLALLMSFGQKP